MSKPFTINGTTFNYPAPGENPDWSEDATDWAEAVTDAIANFSGSGSISQRQATIEDNITTFTDVDGAIFDATQVNAFFMSYFVTRTDGVTEVTEKGHIEGGYNNTSGEWEFDVDASSDAGMEFTVTTNGQIQYKSSSIGGSYVGNIFFRATVLNT